MDEQYVAIQLDDNGAFVEKGTTRITLEGFEEDGEVVKVEFVIITNGREVLRSENEELAIRTFLEIVE